MADEITLSVNLAIRKVNAVTGQPLIDFRRTSSFRASLTGVRGPGPGSMVAKLASEGGTHVDLSHFTQPTWCWVGNQGPADGSDVQDSDHVQLGIWNAQNTNVGFMLEFPPGLFLPLMLSRNIQEIYEGPGTGTAGAGQTGRLMALAYNRQQIFLVEAFDK